MHASRDLRAADCTTNKKSHCLACRQQQQQQPKPLARGVTQGFLSKAFVRNYCWPSLK
jgi:hypothetical protein